MWKTIMELNRGLRRIILIMGGLFALFKLTERKTIRPEDGEDGYQTREFDDIW